MDLGVRGNDLWIDTWQLYALESGFYTTQSIYRFSRINIIYLQGKDRRFSRGRKSLIKLSFRYIAIVRMKRYDKLQQNKIYRSFRNFES